MSSRISLIPSRKVNSSLRVDCSTSSEMTSSESKDGADFIDLGYESIVEISLFNPPESVIKKIVDKKGEEGLMKEQEKTREQLIHLVSSMKAYAPGLSAVMRDFDISEDDAREKFIEWVENIKKSAEKVVEIINVGEEDKDWVIASVEQIISENEEMREVFRLTDFKWLLGKGLFENKSFVPVNVAAPLSLMKAMGAVSKAMVAYSLNRKGSVNEDVRMIAQEIVDISVETLEDMVPSHTSSDLRQAVFCSTVEIAGDIFAQMWVAYGSEQARAWKTKTDAERANWMNANPNGADIEPVVEKFKSTMIRLKRVSGIARPK